MNQSKIEEILTEILDWTKVSNHSRVREVLVQVFGTEDEPKGPLRLVYSLLAGDYTQKQIAKMANIAQPTVSIWATQWKRLGLVRTDGVPAFNLGDFNMKVPKPKPMKANEEGREPSPEVMSSGSED